MSGTERTTFSIEGMHCEHCVEAVRSALDEFEGLRVSPSVYTTLEEIDRFAEVMERVARVSYETDNVSEEDVAEAIQDAGYELAS